MNLVKGISVILIDLPRRNYNHVEPDEILISSRCHLNGYVGYKAVITGYTVEEKSSE
jgi:hypothetical protein